MKTRISNTCAKGIISQFLLAMLGAFFLFFHSARAADEYVFILGARGNPYWQTMAQGIQDTAKARGVSVQIFMQENDTAPETQLNQCETAIQRRPKAIVLSAVNASVGIAALKKAQREGITVADIDCSLAPSVAKENGLNLAFSVGSDNFKIGQAAARYACSLPNGGQSWKDIPQENRLKVLVLEGAPGAVPGRARVDGFVSLLKETAPRYQIVASISANWDRLQAINITTDILQRHPDLYLIYAANDMMALGAAEAVRAAGKSGQIKIIGVDGVADARKAVREGRLAATVAQLPYLIGKRGVELILAKTNGENIEQMQITPTPVLTKELLQANTDPILQYVH